MEFRCVKLGGIYSNHWALQGSYHLTYNSCSFATMVVHTLAEVLVHNVPFSVIRHKFVRDFN